MILGYILDQIIGDPEGFPHIVIGYGKIISALEKLLYSFKNKRLGGMLLAILTILFVALTTGGLLGLVVSLHSVIGIWGFVVLDAILCCQCLAVKCLRVATVKIYDNLMEEDIEAARYSLSMVVGRDTAQLDEEHITAAAVETIAENTSDGIGAPLFYMGIGTSFLSCIYKAVNTMDSMIGYKNDRYMDFGRFAARLDDVANFIPARLTALTMIVAAAICGYDAKGAYRIWKRDRHNSPSPNSAQTEAVMAGALGIRLGGEASYFGKIVMKPTQGDPIRAIEKEDIKRAHRIMSITAFLMLLEMCIVRIGIALVMQSTMPGILGVGAWWLF